MTIDDIMNNAAASVLEMMTTPTTKKAEENILTPDCRVVLVGDQDPAKGLSPIWTETLADEIRRYQRDSRGSGKVEVFWLPEQRPITAENCIDPGFAKAVAEAQVIAGTYGAPEPGVKAAENAEFDRQFLGPVSERLDEPDFRSYHVLARPVESVWNFLADEGAIREARAETIAIQRYLEDRKGQQVQVYTPGARTPLKVRVPEAFPIIADCFAMRDSKLANTPSYETFFSPEGDGKGEIVMGDGTHYHLLHPVKGSIRFQIEGNQIVSWQNETDMDKKVQGYIEEHLAKPENRWFAEVAVGVLGPVLERRGIDIPFEDMVYNITILEKVRPHLAFGGAKSVGGKHKAPAHVDTCFAGMNIYVWNEHLVVDGVPNSKLLEPYMR